MTTGTAVEDSHWTAVDDPDAVADAEYSSVPGDYPAAGPYESSDGRVAAANLWHDLSYRDMVKGVIADKPYQYEMQYDETPTLEWLLSQIPVKYLRFCDPHDHAEGHPKPFDAIFRAHVLRLVKGWQHSTALHRYLKSEPFLVPKLGFEDIPDQSTLHRGWHDRLRHVQDAVEDAAEVLVEVARMHDIPAPDPGFLPGDIDEDDADDETKEALAEEKAQEICSRPSRS